MNADNCTQGLDCSSFQGHIDWQKVAASGIEFAICRAGGARWKDDTFSSNFAQSVAAGLVTGAYYVFYPDVDPVGQAERFYDIAAATQLPPALDLEVKGNEDPMQYVALLSRCIARCTDLFGRKPMLYGSPYFLKTMLMKNDTFSTYPLWVAQYGVKEPSIPEPWEECAIWQYIGNGGKVEGIQNDCDRDVFMGTLEELKSWAQESE